MINVLKIKSVVSEATRGHFILFRWYKKKWVRNEPKRLKKITHRDIWTCQAKIKSAFKVKWHINAISRPSKMNQKKLKNYHN